LARRHQQQIDTTLNTNMPVMTAALAIRGPFFFKNFFAFALDLPPLCNGSMLLSLAGLEPA